ncbi:MAG TPA: hypothetical protein VHZ51_29975 [Ktedonobacteraceae bacterium]|nr:hypothetical protein [Ktedonobacteraceae bacterium]
MDITVAYYAPFFHPNVVKRDFEQIRSVGANSIVYAIHEQEETRYLRDLERGLRQAQDVGLQVYLSLGRFGNLFAGPSLMPSWYTFRHPQSRVQDQHGRSHSMSCFNNEPFRSWLFSEIDYYVSTYPVDGILLDEPRGPDITCYCPSCRALCPDITDLHHFRQRSMLDFFNELFARVKQANTQARTLVSLLPQDLNLIDELAQLPNLDVIGCHLFWQLLNEDFTHMQAWGKTVVETTRRHHKQSQLWLQNFGLDEQGEALLEASFTELVNAEPDSIGCYYYWRNNMNPEQVWDQTRTLLRRTPRRQLYWQTLSRLPVLKIPASSDRTL